MAPRMFPAMRGHQAELPGLDAECGGDAIGFGRGLVTFDRINRKVLYEKLRQPALCTCCSTAFWLELVSVTIRKSAFFSTPRACFTSGWGGK